MRRPPNPFGLNAIGTGYDVPAGRVRLELSVWTAAFLLAVVLVLSVEGARAYLTGGL